MIESAQPRKKLPEKINDLVQASDLLMHVLIESEGDVTQTVAAAFETMKIKEADVTDVISWTLKKLTAQQVEFKKFEEDFKSAKKTIENRIDGLEKWLVQLAMRLDRRELHGHYERYKIVDVASVEITDEAMVPSNFKRTKVTTEPDKKLIGDTLKAGIDVPGAHLVTNLSLRKYIAKNIIDAKKGKTNEIQSQV